MTSLEIQVGDALTGPSRAAVVLPEVSLWERPTGLSSGLFLPEDRSDSRFITKILHEGLLRISARVHFRKGAEPGVRAEDKVNDSAHPLDLARLPITPFHAPSEASHLRHFVPMSNRLTKKSLVRLSGRLVKSPRWDCPKLASRERMPPIRTVISGAVRVSSCAFSRGKLSANPLTLADVVAGSVTV